MLGADGSPKAINELKLSKTQITEQLSHLERQKVEIEKAIGFEKNKPASFKRPLYSFMGDWVMYKDIWTGKIPF